MSLNKSQYLRISVVNTCNLSCFFCHNEGAPITGEKLSIEELVFACESAKKQGFTKFKLTGGEPTIRKDIIELVKRLSDIGLDDLSMITNGGRLVELAQPLREAGLHRLNVSLHTLDEAKYEAMMVKQKVPLAKIIQGIDHAIATGFTDMKINFVYTGRSSEEDLDDLISFVAERAITLVVLPVIEKENDHRTTLDGLYEKFENMGIKEERTIVDNEGILKRSILLESGATLILRKDELGERKPYSFCESCRVKDQCREGIFPLRLSAAGELIPCLASMENRISIKDAVKEKDEATFISAIQEIQSRRTQHA